MRQKVSDGEGERERREEEERKNSGRPGGVRPLGRLAVFHLRASVPETG